MPSAALGRSVRVGLVWSLLNNGIGRAGSTVMGIVLARLLDPRQFGVFAVALVVYTGILSMNELGVSLAVVRWQTGVEAVAATVTTISVVSSGVLYVACYLTAPALADALGAPGSQGIIRVLCLGVVVDGIVAVPAAWLQREFRQGRQTLVDQANFAVGAAVTILLAVEGAGAWSLAWGRLAGNAVSIVMILWACPHKFRFGFDRTVLGPLLRFGAPLAAASLLVFGVLNVDYVVVGSLLGPVALGTYVLAFNLSSWPVNMLSATVRRVSMAGFARQQDDPAAMSASFVQALGLLMVATVPVCGLMAALAGPAVHLVYGSKWAGSSPILSALALLGGCRVAFELAYDYLVAKGRSRACLSAQAVWLVVLAPVLASAAHLGGLRWVGTGHVLVAVIVVVPVFALALRRAGIDLSAAAGVVVRPIAGGLLLAAVAAGTAHSVHGDLLRLVVGAGAGLAAYVPFALPTILAYRQGSDTTLAPTSAPEPLPAPLAQPVAAPVAHIAAVEPAAGPVLTVASDGHPTLSPAQVASPLAVAPAPVVPVAPAGRGS